MWAIMTLKNDLITHVRCSDVISLAFWVCSISWRECISYFVGAEVKGGGEMESGTMFTLSKLKAMVMLQSL